MANRKSIRLPDYNYSSVGEYFITICVNNKIPRLGQIIDNESVLSIEGKIVDKWIQELPAKFTNISIDYYIIMPNHIHLMIVINDDTNIRDIEFDKEENFEIWRIKRLNMLLPKIINYLKSNSSREINRLNKEEGNKFWHANYYEHIIRDDKSYHKIAEYIQNNPSSWEKDMFFK